MVGEDLADRPEHGGLAAAGVALDVEEPVARRQDQLRGGVLTEIEGGAVLARAQLHLRGCGIAVGEDGRGRIPPIAAFVQDILFKPQCEEGRELPVLFAAQQLLAFDEALHLTLDQIDVGWQSEMEGSGGDIELGEGCFAFGEVMDGGGDGVRRIHLLRAGEHAGPCIIGVVGAATEQVAQMRADGL